VLPHAVSTNLPSFMMIVIVPSHSHERFDRRVPPVFSSEGRPSVKSTLA
jgi:hypothetical protein